MPDAAYPAAIFLRDRHDQEKPDHERQANPGMPEASCRAAPKTLAIQ
jgi:hypothetical protein